jgi:hypothetical protein
LAYDVNKFNKQAEYLLKVNFLLAENTVWAKKGHLLAWEQFELQKACAASSSVADMAADVADEKMLSELPARIFLSILINRRELSLRIKLKVMNFLLHLWFRISGECRQIMTPDRIIRAAKWQNGSASGKTQAQGERLKKWRLRKIIHKALR